MSIEWRRKQIMAKQPAWGDPLSPAPRKENTSRDTIGTPPVKDCNNDDETAVLDALIMADVHSRRVKAPYASTSHEKPSSREWTLESLLKKGKNFAEVPRVRWSPEKSTLDQIQEHENASKGVPLVIEGLDRHENWHEDTFTLDCFESDGTKEICVRNVHDRSDQNMLLSEFVARTHEASPFVTPGEDVRLYGKDIQCPRKWNDWLHSANVIPSCLLPKGSNNLLKNLPPSMQVETLMCYLGIGDTFTPCHKDLCASSGHNLMCRTENGGSSFWFMTDTASANTVATFFHEKLKVELDHESHVITLAELMNAPFKVYITEQKLGDLVLVPPRSAHQVWNHGGLTVKTSWSRMTPDGLSLALRYELPLYRRVCRSETYRVKSIIYHTLRDLLSNEPDSSTTPGSTTYVQMNTRHSSMRFETLLHVLKLFDCVLIEEYSQDPKQLLKLLPRLDKSSTINPGDDENERGLTCDFCGSDVFQSFFECRSCVDGGKAELGHGFVTCPGCYVEGRSCRCEVMEPMQCHSFDQLLQLRQRATALIKTWKSDVPVPPTEELFTDEQLGLFRAALILHKRRQRSPVASKDTRKCTPRRATELSHACPIALVLQCKRCHSGTCFAHTTAISYVHSAEAMMVYDKDDTHAAFHQCHKAGKRKFDSGIEAVKKEETDHVPDQQVQLAYLARTFTTCRPLNSKYMMSGWYDLSVWDTSLSSDDNHNTESGGDVTASKEVVVRPRPRKRIVMDYVLLAPHPRPLKRKERTSVITARSTSTRVTVQMAEDTCDDLPLQKKPKRSHPPVRTPGPRIDFAVMDMSSSSRDRTEAISSVNKHPHTKTRVTFFDAASDSDDEPLTKRSRVESRAKKPLTAFCIRKNRSDPAVSVANAYNNALAQNSQRIPNVARRLLSSTAPPLARKPNIRRAPEPATPTPSSRASFSSEGLHTARSGVPSSTIPPLPLPARRQIKRKAPEPLVPPPGPPASSSSEGPHTARRGVASSATPPLPLPSRKPTKRRVEPVAQAPLPLAPSSFEGAHLDLAKEVAELRHFVAEEGALMRTILTQQGHLQAPSFVNPAMVPAIPQANAIDSAYNQFVASVQQAPLRTSGNESVGQILADFVCGVLSGLQSPPRNQIAFRGSRNRGRGRGGAFFAGSPRRSTVAFPQEYRPHRWRSFSGPARPMNDEEESRRHHAETERVWIPGPHANSEHWDPAEQANRQYANQADARRDAHAGQWSTRFAPNLTENLTGVEHRYHDAVPSMRWETSSDSASGTLVGVDPPSVQPDSGRATSSRSGGVRQRTASQDLRNGNPRGEGSSAPREKFFATLDRSTSPDAWEDRYVQDNT